MTAAGPETIFDTDLMTQRLRRLAVAGEVEDFIARHAAAELADRLDGMVRRFGDAAVLSRTGAGDAAAVAASAKLGRVMSASPSTFGFAEASLDCVVALPGLEYVNDLPGALIRLRRALRPDGLFLAAMLCGATLTELRQCWLDAESRVHAGASPRVAPFADIRQLGGLLQRAGFALPVCDVDRLTVRYPSSLALMRELKALGLANPLAARSRRPVTRALLAEAAGLYDARFADPDGRVRATFELAWLTAWSPHESQPKPLRPGSASTRLADALRSVERPLKR